MNMETDTSNTAAMREALDEVTGILEEILDAFERGTGGVLKSDIREAIKRAEAALSAPARNCDREECRDAAMREALKAINCIDTRGLKYLLMQLVEADIYDGGLINKTVSAVEKARRALAAPPRNCDVGTAEEQSRRFDKVCSFRFTGNCAGCQNPLDDSAANGVGDCALFWSQMPYNEEGGAE